MSVATDVVRKYIKSMTGEPTTEFWKSICVGRG